MDRLELLKQYQADLIRIGKSDKTQKDYIYNVGLFLDWLEDTTGEPFKLPLMEVQTRDFTSYLYNIEKKSVSTVNTRLAAVQSFANFLSGSYDMPYIKVQKKKAVKTHEVDVLSEQDFKKLKYMIYYGNNGKPNLLHVAIFEMFHYTGIRESELCALTLDDVTISDRLQYIEVRNGKGGKYRKIKLHQQARKPLLDYLQARPHTDSNAFFIGNRGTLTPNGVYKMINRYGKKANIQQSVYPHLLRHQTMTELASHCETLDDVKNLSSIAGHSSVDTTMKYYVANNREKMDALIDAME